MGRVETHKLKLVLITDATIRKDLGTVAEAALRGGARTVQLREKDAGARELFEWSARLREAIRSYGALLIVNDRLDVALAAGADGVHLGWRSLPVEEARKIVGPERVIGVSVHSVEEAAQAGKDGADYVMFGPVFDTPSKRGLVAPQGLERLAECVRAAGTPVVAVGGILPENAPDVRRAGAAGMAVIRGLMAAASPEQKAREYLEAWERVANGR